MNENPFLKSKIESAMELLNDVKGTGLDNLTKAIIAFRFKGLSMEKFATLPQELRDILSSGKTVNENA